MQLRIKGECSMDGKSKTMDAVYDCHVTSPEPQKIYFGLAEGNGSKVVITIKSHSMTNDIHMRRHFEVMCGI